MCSLSSISSSMRIDKFLIATFYPRPSSARYMVYYIIAPLKKLIFGCRTQSKYIQFSYFSRELWENRKGFIYLPQKRGIIQNRTEQRTRSTRRVSKNVLHADGGDLGGHGAPHPSAEAMRGLVCKCQHRGAASHPLEKGAAENSADPHASMQLLTR